MQDYKTWVGRWLGAQGPGQELARIVHSDTDFPLSANRDVISQRLIELGCTRYEPDGSFGPYTLFLASWKYFTADSHKNPRESSLESKLTHEVQKRGGLCWKFTSPGTAGVPDRIVVTPNGRVIFVEMKAPTGKLQPIQKKRAEELISRDVDWRLLKSNQDIFLFLEEVMPK